MSINDPIDLEKIKKIEKRLDDLEHRIEHIENKIGKPLIPPPHRPPFPSRSKPPEPPYGPEPFRF